MAHERRDEVTDKKPEGQKDRETATERESSVNQLSLLDHSYGKPGDPIPLNGISRDSSRASDTLLASGQLNIPSVWDTILKGPQRADQRTNQTQGELNFNPYSFNQGERVNEKPQVDKPSTGEVKLNLTKEQKEEIGKRIWQNESGGKIEGLTAWNKGESFPSLGIGHFIWQPQNSNSPFGDSFRKVIKSMEDQKVEMPSWLNSGSSSPWPTKEKFDKDFNSDKMKELRTFLEKTIPQQTDVIVNRLQESLPKMLEVADPSKQAAIQDNFNKVLKSGPAGAFALVDYVNFKGEGLKQEATYGNTNWGLRQVLENMKDTGNPIKDFSDSAKKVLADRVANAP
ncbi:MAG: hypothetical protein K2X81_14330, partial [Candidatus Obscuribacterales bacterium]|nr:hypothetical protein [Candidatus Obscuribacterales bacterium]